MLREIDGCLKCTFSHLITLKNKKGSPNVANNVYTPLQTIKKVPHSTFETRLLRRPVSINSKKKKKWGVVLMVGRNICPKIAPVAIFGPRL
jgi:hypothetical protein